MFLKVRTFDSVLSELKHVIGVSLDFWRIDADSIRISALRFHMPICATAAHSSRSHQFLLINLSGCRRIDELVDGPKSHPRPWTGLALQFLEKRIVVLISILLI